MGITGYIPSYVSKGEDDRRGDGLILRSDTGYTLIVDGFDGSAPTTKLINWLKERKITELYLALSHPHYDHYKGLRTIMEDRYITIRRLYCYDPESIAHGIGSSANGRSVKEDYDNLKAVIAQARGRGAEVVYLKTGDSVTLGDIRFRVWRKQPTGFTDLDDGNAYAFTNNGSLCFYFPDFRLLLTGDGPEALKEAIAYFGDVVLILKVPHHGNNCSKSNAQAAKKAGCILAYETNIEAKGPGTTGFTAYGSRRVVEEGITVLMQDTDIWILVTDRLLTVVQGKKEWKMAVPYTTGEWRTIGGIKYYYKDGRPVTGSVQIDGAWYYFDKTGAQQRGFVTIGKYSYWYSQQTGELTKSAWISDGKVWRYFDEWGMAQTGWFKDASGKWCYLDPKTKGGKLVKQWWYDPSQKAWYRLDEKGWMCKAGSYTIDGRTYRFDDYGRLIDGSGKLAKKIADGVIKSAFTSVTKVVDVSEFQPASIDWEKVKAAGYGVILRMGIRGSITGSSGCGKIRYDKHYETYLRGVLKAGIPYGVYFFPTSISDAEAEEEAKWIISNVRGLHLSFPVYLDSEMVNDGKGRADRLSRADRTRYLKIICDKLTAAGIECGIYASTYWLENNLDMSQFSDVIRDNTWVAQYAASCTYKGAHRMWQYTSKGSVPGINGNVDVSTNYAAVQSVEPAAAVETSAGKFPRKAIISLAQSLVGTQEGSSVHRKIIDAYNSYGRQHGNLPRGYAVTYKDAWCATFCSYLAIACGYTSIIPYECGCPQWVTQAKVKGIWKEADSYVPKMGDFILYDWQDSGSGDNTTGSPDHIGIVERVSGITITVIEGNYQDQVRRRMIQINGRYIRGYVTPKYSD